jgi:hypothetical protein
VAARRNVRQILEETVCTYRPRSCYILFARRILRPSDKEEVKADCLSPRGPVQEKELLQVAIRQAIAVCEKQSPTAVRKICL